ncbi:filamentous hemagglutinin N-terminal domain-containing protein, partial [Herbaspirillum sp. RTI4]
MNQLLYRLIFNKKRGMLMVVAETATSHDKGSGNGGTGSAGSAHGGAHSCAHRGKISDIVFVPMRSIALASALLSGSALLLSEPPKALAQTLPQGGVVAAGAASIAQTNANSLLINQSSNRAVLNWNSFNIGAGNSVQFQQPGSSAAVLNRVTGLTGSSQIMGTLTANGQVFLVNPQGIVFGNGAMVNVAGLMASTKDIGNAAFMSGNQDLIFGGAGTSNGLIQNSGSLTALGGYVVLMGDQVRNSGVINAAAGRVVLAAGDQATISLSNGQLVNFVLSNVTANALVEQSGAINAANGQVLISAQSANALLNDVINLTGVINVSGSQGSVIVNGGAAGTVNLSGATISVANPNGIGGNVTLTGQQVGLFGQTFIDASGSTGGGTVLVGGDYQGSNAGTVAHAQATVMSENASIDASVTGTGNGGRVVLWSDNYTGFYGNIAARGGAQGGDGGAVETSSHNNLQAFGSVDASTTAGHAGSWLLDPVDITISSASNSNYTGGVHTGFTAGVDSSATVSNATINSVLSAGTSVTISTANSSAVAFGDIAIVADIIKSSGANTSLTLTAGRNILFDNAKIRADFNLMNLTMNAGNTISFNNALVELAGGNLQVTANGSSGGNGVNFFSNNTFSNVVGFINGSSAAGNGVTFSGNASTAFTETGIGTLNITGISNGTNDALLLGSGNIVQDNASTLNLNGCATASGAYGVTIAAGTNVQQVNNGVIHIVANGVSTAMNLAGNLTQASTGSMSVSGTSTTGMGINLSGVVNQSGAGALTLTGTGIDQGVYVQGQILQSSTGSMGLTGTASGSNASSTAGLYFDSGTSLLQSSTGSLTLSGTASNASALAGVYFSNTSLTQTNPGTLTINGAGPSGVNFAGSSNLTLNNTGTLNVNGNGSTGPGFVMGGGTNLTLNNTTATIGGTSTNSTGIDLAGTSSLLGFNAVAILTGTSTNGTGARIEGAWTQSSDASLSVTGTSTNGSGVAITANTTNSGAGSLFQIAGTSTNGDGAVIGAPITVSSGATLNLAGTSTNGTGLNVTAPLTQSTTSQMDLTGTSTAGIGLQLSGAASITQDATTTLFLTGQNTNGSISAPAIMLASSNLSSLAGTTTISATGNMVMDTNNVLALTGALTITNTGNLTLGGSLSGGSGSLTANSNGYINVSGNLSLGSLSLTSGLFGIREIGSGKINVAGASNIVEGNGDITLNGNNTLNGAVSIAASGSGLVALNNASNLSLGTVSASNLNVTSNGTLTANGNIAATGSAALSANGNLTLNGTLAAG